MSHLHRLVRPVQPEEAVLEVLQVSRREVCAEAGAELREHPEALFHLEQVEVQHRQPPHAHVELEENRALGLQRFDSLRRQHPLQRPREHNLRESV